MDTCGRVKLYCVVFRVTSLPQCTWMFVFGPLVSAWDVTWARRFPGCGDPASVCACCCTGPSPPGPRWLGAGWEPRAQGSQRTLDDSRTNGTTQVKMPLIPQAPAVKRRKEAKRKANGTENYSAELWQKESNKSMDPMNLQEKPHIQISSWKQAGTKSMKLNHSCYGSCIFRLDTFTCTEGIKFNRVCV